SDTELLQKELHAKEEKFVTLKAAHDQVQQRNSELAKALETSQREVTALRNQRYSGSEGQQFDLPTIGFTNYPQNRMPLSGRRFLWMLPLSLIIAAVLWEAIAYLVGREFLWPHLQNVLFVPGTPSTALLESTGITLYTVMIGYAVGAGLGVL